MRPLRTGKILTDMGTPGVNLDHQQEVEDEVDTEFNATEGDVLKMNKIFEMISSQSKSIGDLVLDLIAKVKSADIQEEGLPFLTMKNHLLIDYLMNLLKVVGAKCAGESIVDSPAVDKLVEIRTVLEKIRPIDHKMKYQIEKMTRASVEGRSDSDPLQFKANPDELDRSDSSEDDSGREGQPVPKPKAEVYRPPKVVPQHYDDEDESKVVEKVKRKSINRALIRELQEEFLDTPVEVHNLGDAYEKQLSHEVRDKQRYEETYMTRLPVTKVEKHRQNQLSTVGVLGREVTDFSRKRKSAPVSKKRKGTKGGKKKFRK